MTYMEYFWKKATLVLQEIFFTDLLPCKCASKVEMLMNLNLSKHGKLGC